jgi:nucleoside 2-deoxyribosyltransferase
MEENKCPVCGSEARYCTAGNSFEKNVQCERCGIYYFDRQFLLKSGELEPSAKSCMYYILTHNIFGHKRLNPNDVSQPKILFFSKEEKEDGFIKDHYIISEKTLYDYLPKNFLDRVDKVLINLGEYIGEIGESISFHCGGTEDIFNVICFVENSIQNNYGYILQLFKLIKEIGYLSQTSDKGLAYIISAKGWAHLEELKKSNKVENQVFIAMCFNNNILPENSKIRNSIKNVIESNQFNYKAVIIDEKQYNGLIVPEIFYEINRSSFVVADLTAHRNGVYYEAGYAEALGKEVILTCKEDHFNDRHFDVAQKNIIVWKDYEDLEKRLADRIRAKIGESN